MEARIEQLLRKVERLRQCDLPIPLDLTVALLECGIDVRSL